MIAPKYDHLMVSDMEYFNLLQEVASHTQCFVYPFGSRYSMGKDHPYGDTDVLILASNPEDTRSSLEEMGYQAQFAAGYAGSHIASWRCGDINAVVIDDPWEFWARCACVEYCRTQKMQYREDRAQFHAYIADVARVKPEDEFGDSL